MKDITQVLQRDLMGSDEWQVSKVQDDKEYENWVAWRATNESEPMTRTQSLLAKEVLGNEKLTEMLSQPGDLQVIIKSIQQYLKDKK